MSSAPKSPSKSRVLLTLAGLWAGWRTFWLVVDYASMAITAMTPSIDASMAITAMTPSIDTVKVAAPYTLVLATTTAMVFAPRWRKKREVKRLHRMRVRALVAQLPPEAMQRIFAFSGSWAGVWQKWQYVITPLALTCKAWLQAACTVEPTPNRSVNYTHYLHHINLPPTTPQSAGRSFLARHHVQSLECRIEGPSVFRDRRAEQPSDEKLLERAKPLIEAAAQCISTQKFVFGIDCDEKSEFAQKVDITPLLAMKNVRFLKLTESPVQVDTIRKLTWVERLHLPGNCPWPVSSIITPAHTRLNEVVCRDMSYADMEALLMLPALTSLNASYWKDPTISVGQGLLLDVAVNGVKEALWKGSKLVSYLPRFTKLRSLEITEVFKTNPAFTWDLFCSLSPVLESLTLRFVKTTSPVLNGEAISRLLNTYPLLKRLKLDSVPVRELAGKIHLTRIPLLAHLKFDVCGASYADTLALAQLLPNLEELSVSLVKSDIAWIPAEVQSLQPSHDLPETPVEEVRSGTTSTIGKFLDKIDSYLDVLDKFDSEMQRKKREWEQRGWHKCILDAPKFAKFHYHMWK